MSRSSAKVRDPAVSNYVLDSFALIAWFRDEPGANTVQRLLERAEKNLVHIYVSWVNITEVYYLTKRRSIVKLDELERLANANLERGWAGYWFHRRLLARGLEPRCQISYHRTARIAMTTYGPIRLTLDENLRALPAAGLWFSEQKGTCLLENQIILELKFRCEMPVLFKYLVEEFALNPQPVSKYRLAAVALGLVAITSTADNHGTLTPQYA